MLILAIAGVAPEVIASDYALSFERLPAPVIRRYLAERGTTAERVIVDCSPPSTCRRRCARRG